VVEQYDTVVIGAGQAGLAASYHLTQRGRDHVVLERGKVGETWRSQRWDGFYLNTPNWTLQLPGHQYDGPDPDGFAPLPEVIRYLEDGAALSKAPVREGVHVIRLSRVDQRYLLETEDGAIETDAVIVATGAYQTPGPQFPVPDGIVSLHSSEYRRPEQLPPGAVLVVGGGQSGCQIAEELLDAGRPVYLSVGRCGWLPRRYRGRDILAWALDIGFMDQTIDTLPSPAARLACNPSITGTGGGHDLHPRLLAARGAVVVGRFQGIDAGVLSFAGDLEATLRADDEIPAKLCHQIDEFILARGLDVPPDDPDELTPADIPLIERLDFSSTAITSILWATGFRPDLSWIDLPLADEQGWPVHRRGATSFPGLYFVGLHWLRKRKSSLLMGVAEDAEYVVDHLTNS
jgi:putative flavoprotein involved in K+ transport